MARFDVAHPYICLVCAGISIRGTLIIVCQVHTLHWVGHHLPCSPRIEHNMAPKKTKGSVSKRVTWNVPETSKLGLQGKARVKRTQGVRGRPKKLSAEETEQLAAEWNTITIGSLRQAKTLLDQANEQHPALARNLVKNLWCHTTVLADSKGDPTLTRADILSDPAREIVANLASGGTVENLAIDVTLLSEGWLFNTAARPSHVMVLSDEFPCRPYTLSWRTRLFEKTTHVVFQPLLGELLPRMPVHGGLKALFPKMRFCCIQIDAVADTKQATAFVEQFLSTVDRLCIFVGTGFEQYCTSDAPIWVAMRALTKQHPKLAVFPYQISFKKEWEKLLAGEETIWEAEVDDELCEALQPTVNHEVNWQAAFSGSSRWDEEDNLPSVGDSLLFQRRQRHSEGRGKDTAAKDALTDLSNWSIPGSLTLDEEFQALFPFHLCM